MLKRAFESRTRSGAAMVDVSASLTWVGRPFKCRRGNPSPGAGSVIARMDADIIPLRSPLQSPSDLPPYLAGTYGVICDNVVDRLLPLLAMWLSSVRDGCHVHDRLSAVRSLVLVRHLHADPHVSLPGALARFLDGLAPLCEGPAIAVMEGPRKSTSPVSLHFIRTFAREFDAASRLTGAHVLDLHLKGMRAPVYRLKPDDSMTFIRIDDGQGCLLSFLHPMPEGCAARDIIEGEELAALMDVADWEELQCAVTRRRSEQVDKVAPSLRPRRS